MSERCWRNWSGDQACRPAHRVACGSRDDVVSAVGRAAESAEVLRVAGSGHSFSDVVATAGTLVDIGEMRQLTNRGCKPQMGLRGRHCARH